MSHLNIDQASIDSDRIDDRAIDLIQKYPHLTPDRARERAALEIRLHDELERNDADEDGEW